VAGQLHAHEPEVFVLKRDPRWKTFIDPAPAARQAARREYPTHIS